MLNTLILLTALLVPAVTSARSLASIKHNIRVEHARELMGSGYKKSVVSKVEKKNGLEQKILATVKARLPGKYKHEAWNVTQTIITEAEKYSFDPYFVMAVIEGESSFNPLAIGPVGEIGLMQIRPTTAKWIADRMKDKWQGENSLRDPVTNIKLGTAYLSYLRTKFQGQSQLYLAAYNMGATSVKRALGRNVRPKDYPRHVMKRYLAFYREASASL